MLIGPKKLQTYNIAVTKRLRFVICDVNDIQILRFLYLHSIFEVHNSSPNKCVTVHYETKTLKNTHCLDTLSLASQPGTTENPAVSVISAEEKIKVGRPVEDQLIILKTNFSSLYLDRVNRKRSKSTATKYTITTLNLSLY